MRRSAAAGIVMLLVAGLAPATAAAATKVRVTYTVPASASRAQIARTAARMQERFRTMGAAGTRVVVHGHRLQVSGPRAVDRLAAGAAARGVLELRPVRNLFPAGGPGPSGPDVRASEDPAAPTSYVVGPPGLVGRVASAVAMRSPAGADWIVEIGFTPAGLRALNRMARAQYERPPPGNSVAILVDDRVEAAPAFMTGSFSGPVEISGGFTRAKALQLAAILVVGPYPIPVTRVR